MTLKRCQECEREILGRTDKKYCSDMCRNNYNNRERSKEHQIVRQINCMLLRNRKILSRLLTSKVSKISRNKLMEQAFISATAHRLIPPEKERPTCFVMSMVFWSWLMDNSAWSNVQSSINDLTLQFVLTIDK